MIAISRRKNNPFLYENATIPIEHVYLDNFDHLNSISHHFKDIDEAYCCNYDKDLFRHIEYDYTDSFAQLVYESFKSSKKPNKVKQFFIVSTGAIGADSNSSFFYKRVKGDIEKNISQIHLNSLQDLKLTSSLELLPFYCHIIKPGILIGERENERFIEGIAQNVNSLLSYILPKSMSGIEGETVAKSIIQISRQVRCENCKDGITKLMERDYDSMTSSFYIERNIRLENGIFTHPNASLKEYADEYII